MTLLVTVTEHLVGSRGSWLSEVWSECVFRHEHSHEENFQGFRTHGLLAKLLPIWSRLKRGGKALLGRPHTSVYE